MRCFSSVIAAGSSGLLMLRTWGNKNERVIYLIEDHAIYGVELKGYVSEQS